MADVNAKVFELLGKYVSFKYDSNFDHIGVIDSVSFYLDGRVEIGLLIIIFMILLKYLI